MLEDNKTHKLAVYGTLKNGFGNHHVLGDVKTFIGAGKTKDNFYMNGMGVPVVWKHPVAPVCVEVYEVPETQLTGRIDALESNGYYYNREKTTITMGDGSEEEAWLYFGMTNKYQKDFDPDIEAPKSGYYEWGGSSKAAAY